MPLVVPGLMSKDGNSSGGDDWLSKLAGKKIGEQHNETTFAKTDLPKEHRILKPDSMKTMDFKPDRLNIHVTDDGTVEKVSQG
ncbi:hypothetical protein IQ06DRAFT_278242 [Phaeosphaeriaceae sp. SRC1lsM3a]|nr:hypothetical protein IQ06DRAFT_278242 [Stagonospora sp. SRC1lsM3a]